MAGRRRVAVGPARLHRLTPSGCYRLLCGHGPLTSPPHPRFDPVGRNGWDRSNTRTEPVEDNRTNRRDLTLCKLVAGLSSV